MFLNGIKYQVAGANGTYSYKFESSESRFRNILFHEESGQGKHLVHALTYALTGKEHSQIAAVMLYVADGNGDQWQVERRGDRSRYLKNRQLVDGNGEQLFKEAILDGQEIDSVLFDFFFINYENHHLISRRDIELSPFLSFYQERGQEKLSHLIESTCKFLTSDHSISLSNLVSFASKSRGLIAEYKESSRNLKILHEKYGSLQDLEPDFADSLEKEVGLLRILERDADFLQDPATSYDVLKQKLKKINHQLKELCDKNSIAQLPALDNEIQWDKVIFALSRLQAFERLEQAFRSSNNHVENMIKPLFQEHIRSIKGFLSDDKKLLGEIERALQSLTTHLQLVSSSEPVEELGVIKKLFGDKGKVKEPNAPLDPHILDASRQSVDQVLRSLGAMCSNLEMMTSSYTDGLDSIQERYEKIVKELGRAKKEWLDISKMYNLDPNSNLKSMLSLINNLGQLSSLYSKKKDVKHTLGLYRNRLRLLERQIREWRTLTGSQKSNDLSQVPILINEIRNMIQYKEKKEAQLKKAQKLKAKVDFYLTLRKSYESSLKACKSKWSNNFALLDLKTIDIDARNWNQFFLLVDQTKACSDLIQLNSNRLKDEEIVSSKNLLAPLNIFKIDHLDREGRLEFLRQLEFLSPHSNLLILFEDRELKEMLEKVDIGSSRPIKPRNSIANPSSSDNNKSDRQPVISEKARAALELFKGRSGDIS